ncbi:50S ribosomal protein L13 [Candidatus Micrarchaeota archaeon]|nr:50S ribosomal protein L13 [Candidatus Micrarchaeota archaeon]
MLVVDGTNHVLGRLGSQIAKKILNGEEVHLINSENIVITGSPQSIIEKYKQRRRIKHKGRPEKSPNWPRVPNMLVRRIIRGMLPWKSATGREAFKKLKTYTGNPGKFESAKEFQVAKFNGNSRFITLGELCRQLGYQVNETSFISSPSS